MNALLPFEWLFSTIVVERLGWVLVQSLWQFAVVALLVRVTLGAMHPASATTRYGVLVFAMTAAMAAPLATWMLQRDAAPAARTLSKSSSDDEAVESNESGPSDGNTAVPVDLPNRPPSSDESVTKPSSESPPSKISDMGPPAESWTDPIVALLEPWLAWIVAGWSVGGAICSGRPILSWHTLRRLQRVGVSPASDEMLAATRRVSAKLGVRRAVRVLESTLTRVPIVVGYFRPVILLPVSLVTTIPAVQLDAILAHELAHVRRHDFLVNLLQTLIETLFFYHPAVWWLSHRIRVEREHCCDDLVVELFNNRVEYGRALVAVEELRGRSTVLVLGAAEGSVLGRVRRITGLNANENGARLSGRWPVASVALACLGVASVLLVSLCLAGKNDDSEVPRSTIARLPGEITVELIGVGFHPSKDREWWKPDGTALEQRPIRKQEFNVMPGSPEQAQCREFVIHIHGLPRGHSVVTDYGTVPSAACSTYSEGLWVGEHGAGPFQSKTTSIRVGLTTEPFGPPMTIDVNGRKPVLDGVPADLKPFYDRIVPLRVEESEGQTELLLDGPPLKGFFRSAAWELHAIDVDGQRIRSTAESVPVSGEHHFGFKLPRARLTRFEFRMRPYRHWATFENVSLEPGRKTKVRVKTESLPNQNAEGPRFADEMQLTLTRAAAHGGRWFFVDLDLGRLANPPFEVELDQNKLPFTVLRPFEDELKQWLTENGIDLMLFVEPKYFDERSRRWTEVVATRSIQTSLGFINGLLETPHREGQPWRYKDRPADVVAKFARRDEATHVSGFVPASSAGHSIRPDSPALQTFRTADNVVGFYLLEHNDLSRDELSLRIVQVANATTPLADVAFDGRFVSGKNGAADSPRPVRALVARLPNDLEVELIGVTRNAEPAAEGWTSDGRPLGNAGIWAVGTKFSIQDDRSTAASTALERPNENARDLLLRMRGLKSEPSYRVVDFEGATGWSHMPLADPYQNRLTILTDKPADIATLTLLITDEPWGPSQQVSPTGELLNQIDDPSPYASHYGKIKLLRLGPRTGDEQNTEIRLQWPRNHGQLFDFRIEAIQTGGREAVDLYVSDLIDVAGADSVITSFVPSKAIPRERLARFEYRLRPYRHSVTFKDVSLKAGLRTEARATAESIRDPDLRALPALPDNPMARELELFQGAWIFKDCISKTWSVTRDEAQRWRWTVEGDQITWAGAGGEVWKLSFTIDPTKSPKQLDLTFLDGPHKGETCASIYTTEGQGQLIWLCLKDPGATAGRPADFLHYREGGQSLFILSPVAPNSAEIELASLQGTWMLETIQTDGWPKPVGNGLYRSGPGDDLQWVVKKNEITWTGPGGAKVNAAFTIDPTQSPKQFDLTFLSGPDKGKKCLGAYERGGLGGKTLWLCVLNPGSNADRPTDISHSTNDGRSMIELIRVKDSVSQIPVDAKPKSKAEPVPPAKSVENELTADSDGKQVRTGTNAAADWGPVANSLRARLVPVSSEMSEDAIEPAQRMARFANPEDVAFVFELENVSDTPIKLLDTRYGEGYGDSMGKANSNWYGQFLFSIDLFDRDGEKIERPEVQVVDLNNVLGGALVATLNAGQTHRFLLRPARWLSPLTQRLQPGIYRAVARYHGLPARVATRIREYRPTSSVLVAVEGDIVSRQVPFELTQPASNTAATNAKSGDPKTPDAAGAMLVWGEPTNGLRAAMDLLPKLATYAHGMKPDVKFHVQNVDDTPIVLSSHLWLPELRATVKDEKGNPVDLGGFMYTGWTLSCRVTLKPKQIVTFDAGNIAFAPSKELADKFEHVTNRKLIGPAGRYTMQFEGSFGRDGLLRDGTGKQLAPLTGDWKGMLTTRETPLVITERTTTVEN